MTTYQEPPLQSRRAARENERAESASGSSSRPGGGEPLNYVTQNRPLLPGYDTPPVRGRRAADPAPPPVSEPQTETPAFRVRDYSPEARRAAPAWEVTDESADPGVVEYQTQARAAVVPPAVVPEPPSPAPTATPQSLASALNQPGDPSEHTLTRRELRALREAHGISAVPTDATPIAPLAEAPGAEHPVPTPAPGSGVGSPLVDPSPQLQSALAEFDALAAADRPTRSGRRAAVRAEAASSNFESLFTPPSQIPDESSAFVLPEPTGPAAAVPTPPFPSAPAPAAPAAPDAPAASFLSERPAGHWTNQADLDDRTQQSESPVSRRIGSGGLTTSALVLPSLPGQGISTGDIRVTGSIALPHRMSSIGAHPSQVDESDLDHLLDPGDHQVVSTDSIPIRATRAVSSHTSSRGIISAVKPRGNRALSALIISAAGMAVVVVTLLIVALATNVL